MSPCTAPLEPRPSDDIQLSGDQADAVHRALAWWMSRSGGVFKLFGFAGTGKTTTANVLIREAESAGARVLCVAPTGKAASVLAEKTGRPAMTLHAAIYKFYGLDEEDAPIFGLEGGGRRRPISSATLVLLDECSMVGQTVAADLLRFGVPVLAMGDPFQLPPVKAAAGFDMESPDVLLRHVHRQALDNPLLRASMLVREGDIDAARALVPRVEKATVSAAGLASADQVLCGTHRTRLAVNTLLRRHLGFAGDGARAGEKIIALRNKTDLDVWNGETRTVAHEHPLSDERTLLTLAPRDSGDGGGATRFSADLRGFARRDYTQDERRARTCLPADYGYALTVHKSQGSEWNRVALIDDWRGADYARWLYTGLTRARERAVLITSKS